MPKFDFDFDFDSTKTKTKTKADGRAFVPILPRNNLKKEDIDVYIEENQLILDVMKEYQNVGDFDGVMKYARRACDNLSFLWEVVNICNTYDTAESRRVNKY